METEILRRAAVTIRDEWADLLPIGRTHPGQDFHLAVAAWLENSADMIDGLTEVGKPTHVVPPGCFAVARAYLGEQP